MNRISKVISDNNLDCLILTDGYNIHYLSGYRGHCGMALFLDGRRVILTDSRYTEQVSLEAPDFECIDIGQAGYYEELSKLIGPVFEKNKGKAVRIGFENEEISFLQYSKIVGALDKLSENGYELVGMDNRISSLRMVKNKDELSKIKRAEQIGDEAFSHILGFIREGMTEKQIALELEYTMKSMGAEGLSFDTIAASGENSSLPHATPTDRIIKNGDFLTMDFGCVYEGYCSDMTRTVFIGSTISKEQKRVYDTVLEAQLAALSMIKPGVKCYDVDACAREIIAKAGYGDFFGHGLGHSVGLYIHEEPRCSKKCDTILEAGMVMTCEPGIYLPARFGVRIEDLVVVTETGYENYAHSPKELIYIENS